MRSCLAATALFVGLSLGSVAAAQTEAPPLGAWLRYRYEQRLLDGTGEYVGYQESTRAHARYEVSAVEPDHAEIHGRYAWSYASTDASRSGAENRIVSFGLPSRRYLEALTDVSDLDALDGPTLATWIWIPPSSAAGSEVEILERSFRIVATDALVEIYGATRPATLARAAYTSARDDDYGQHSTTIVDEYWYDPATGMFLREHHVERCTGTLEGAPAAFTLDTTIELVDASYAPAPSPPPEDDYSVPPAAQPIARPSYRSSSYGSSRPSYDSRSASRRRLSRFFPFLCAGGAVLLVVVMFWALVRRRRGVPLRTATGELVELSELGSPPVPRLGPLSPTFDPFLPHMIAIARATGQKVVYATTGGRVLGVGIDDAPAELATIFAADSDTCEGIRKSLGRMEFFSEVRHPRLASVAKSGVTSPAEAYNVYETYELLELRARPEDLGYDTEVVDPLGAADVAEVVALLDAVYEVPCRAWLEASLAAGDVGWVAREGKRVVGVALATLIGTRGRLHGLTVLREHRGRGLGAALYRARLRGLFDLGVEQILTECATWNLGALDLARAHGFTKVGLMYVESARSARLERKLVRR